MVSDLLFLAGLVLCLISMIVQFCINPAQGLFFLGVFLIVLGILRHLRTRA